MEKVKIVAIQGSHRKEYNTDFAVRCAIESAQQLGDWIETEVIDLSKLTINQCTATYTCYSNGSYDLPCPDYGPDDDLNKHRIIQKMVEADGLIIASPVYFGSVSGKVKDLMDRTLMCCHASPIPDLSGKLENKVGGAIAVSLTAHGGVELTLNTIYMWMINHDMIVVGPGFYPPAGCITGGGAYGKLAKYWKNPDAIRNDIYGMRSIRHVGKRVAEVATYMKLSQKPAKKWAEEVKPTYKEGPIKIDWDRFLERNLQFTREHVSICEYVGISKEGFEKYISFQEKIASEDKARNRMAYGKGMQNAETFKESWLNRDRVVFLSDDQIYHHNPEFWDHWVLPGTKKEG
jgi:multimeric flavodoxin WrbA